MLQTFKDLKVNQITKGGKIEKYLESKKLKTGESVKYRLLNGTKNMDPNAVKGKNDWLWPYVQRLLKTRLKDPDSGQVVDIAVVKEVDGLVIKKYGLLEVPVGNRGIFYVHEGLLDEEEAYPVLELMNENKSNPFRDASVEALFERVDEVALAKLKVAKRKLKQDVMDYIAVLDMTERRLLHAANGGNFDDDPDVVTDSLQELAEKDPVWFDTMVNSRLTPIKAIVKQALEKEHIQFDSQTNQYKWLASGEVIASLDRIEGVAPAQQFAEWLDTNKNGDAITKQMKNLIAPPKPEAKAKDKAADK